MGFRIQRSGHFESEPSGLLGKWNLDKLASRDYQLDKLKGKICHEALGNQFLPDYYVCCTCCTCCGLL